MKLIYIVINGCIGDGYTVVGAFDNMELAEEVVLKEIAQEDQNFIRKDEYNWEGKMHKHEYIWISKVLLNDYKES